MTGTVSRLLQANEMLLFNKKLTAAQACDLGLVTEVFPDSSFQAEVWTRLKGYGKLPPNVSKHTCRYASSCPVPSTMSAPGVRASHFCSPQQQHQGREHILTLVNLTPLIIQARRARLT